jgi:hypothetical protein
MPQLTDSKTKRDLAKLAQRFKKGEISAAQLEKGLEAIMGADAEPDREAEAEFESRRLVDQPES